MRKLMAVNDGRLVATAESCTGGMIAAAITDLAGSSSLLDRGFVTYSNAAKVEMLGVLAATLDAHGAVSAQTAQEMACGARANASTNVSATVAVTGVAGPGGGSAEKPVGLVYIATDSATNGTHVERCLFDGDRASVRRQTTERALTLLISALS